MSVAARISGASLMDLATATQTAEPSAAERAVPSPGAPLRVRTLRLRMPTLIVVILGLVVTVVLTILARGNYTDTEQRLTALQTRLTGQLLETAPLQIESTLDRVAGLSAESNDPVATFESAIAPSMRPRGQFVSSSLVLVPSTGPRVLAHLGATPIRNPEGAVSTAIYERAARSTSLVTTRAVSHGVQRLGFLVSAHGPGGTFVVGAGQQLPAAAHIAIPAGSPEAQLNVALYYGKRVRPSDLIATNSPSLPISGTSSRVTESFGTSWLTLVAAPSSPLTGGWAENLPWVILVAGLALTASAAVIAEWLARRRSLAETVAGETHELYQEQRIVAETLQVALLPKDLPLLRGFDVAARYLPATRGVEVGGDWYSVTPVDPDRFVFVVGDVSGHGISAASTMAILRFTIRALAKLGLPPAEILERANGEINVVDGGHFATALIGSVDISAGTLTLASAGHLPPLLVRPSGSAYVDLAVRPPLGLRQLSFEERTIEFACGSTLVAFTDGLVERRDTGIDAGLDRLAFVASSPEAAPSNVMASVLADLPGPDHEDDVAFLVIRRLDEVARPPAASSAADGPISTTSPPGLERHREDREPTVPTT